MTEAEFQDAVINVLKGKGKGSKGGFKGQCYNCWDAGIQQPIAPNPSKVVEREIKRVVRITPRGNHPD